MDWIKADMVAPKKRRSGPSSADITGQNYGGFEMNKKAYSEKLKDPRWQKKRLEILNRDEWMCQSCQDTESMLVVHHLSYEKGKEPWEYPDDNFLTLCESCHQREFDERPQYEEALLRAIRSRGFLSDDLYRLINGFLNVPIIYASEVTASIIEFALINLRGAIAESF